MEQQIKTLFFLLWKNKLTCCFNKTTTDKDGINTLRSLIEVLHQQLFLYVSVKTTSDEDKHPRLVLSIADETSSQKVFVFETIVSKDEILKFVSFFDTYPVSVELKPFVGLPTYKIKTKMTIMWENIVKDFPAEFFEEAQALVSVFLKEAKKTVDEIVSYLKGTSFSEKVKINNTNVANLLCNMTQNKLVVITCTENQFEFQLS